jgi:acyl carrier protein
VAPDSHMEKILAGILQTYFGMEQVGAEDNFFELGATSLDILQLNRKIIEATGRDIPVSAFFRYPNISFLASHLQQAGKNTAAPGNTGEEERPVKMQKARKNLQKRTKILKA